MAIYFAQNVKGHKALSHIDDKDKYNNQVIFNGTDEEYEVPNGIFFLEFVSTPTGNTVTITDWSNNTVADGISDFNQEHSPLRIEGGIKVSGQVTLLKGFFLREVYSK